MTGLRVALYAADGRTPLAFHGGDAEQDRMRDKAIIVECFGALQGLQLRGEWTQLEGGPEEGLSRLIDAIIDAVGREVIVERYKRYGVRFANEDPGGEPVTPALPPAEHDPHCGHCGRLYVCDVDGPCGDHDDGSPEPTDDGRPGHTDPSRPFGVIQGDKTE